MSKIEELRDGIAFVGAVLREMHEAAQAEGRDFTAEEEARWAEGEKYVLETKQAIEREEARAQVLEAAAVAGQPGDGARDFQYQRKVDTRVDLRSARPGEIRDAALKSLERAEEVYDLTDAAKVQAERLIRRGDGQVAARVAVTEQPEYRSAWMKVMTGQSSEITPEEGRALAEAREMNITTAADGGYGVPVFIDPTIILTDQESSNPFRQNGTSWRTITTADWKGVSAAGVTWAFETESAAANDISPTLAQPSIHAHKAQGFIPFTIEVGMDYPGFAAEMARLLGAGYDELLVDKLTRGSGTGEPWGIFEACEQATSQVVVTTDGALHAADINKVFAALPQKYRRNASWLMHIDVNQDIQALGDDKLASQTVNLAAGAIDVLKNRPVFESPYAPTFTGTTGAASILVLGDFSNFVVAQRAGMSVEFVPHVFDTSTGTPNGQRGWYAWARVGADSVNDNAFRMLVNT